ncbi:MAG: threonine synthase [Myxococcota bacterium]
MRFYSTQDHGLRVTLEQAVLQSLPADGGLYLPERIPRLGEAFWSSFHHQSFSELGFHVARSLLGDAVSPQVLETVVNGSLDFDAPLVQLTENEFILELFHGPTLAFKDFGARFMARLMSHLRTDSEVTVLVATSGDTGAAVAAGYHRVQGMTVYILYPSGRVSPLQEKQLTTWGDNVIALEVDGTFDDCQSLVKAAFLDVDLQKKRTLTSANSINLARLIPQSFYYFRAIQQLRSDDPTTIVVPSGNLGNVTAGLLAHRMGLPVSHFVAAQNQNDSLVQYLRTGHVPDRTAVRTHSNAMDVAQPSNLARVVDLFRDEKDGPEPLLTADSVDDEDTLDAMRRVYERHRVFLDPHTAVGWVAAERLNPVGGPKVVLATAHPAKFPEAVRIATGRTPPMPERLAAFQRRTKKARPMSAEYAELRAILSG